MSLRHPSGSLKSPLKMRKRLAGQINKILFKIEAGDETAQRSSRVIPLPLLGYSKDYADYTYSLGREDSIEKDDNDKSFTGVIHLDRPEPSSHNISYSEDRKIRIKEREIENTETKEQTIPNRSVSRTASNFMDYNRILFDENKATFKLEQVAKAKRMREKKNPNERGLLRERISQPSDLISQSGDPSSRMLLVTSKITSKSIETKSLRIEEQGYRSQSFKNNYLNKVNTLTQIAGNQSKPPKERQFDKLKLRLVMKKRDDIHSMIIDNNKEKEQRGANTLFKNNFVTMADFSRYRKSHLNEIKKYKNGKMNIPAFLKPLDQDFNNYYYVCDEEIKYPIRTKLLIPPSNALEFEEIARKKAALALKKAQDLQVRDDKEKTLLREELDREKRDAISRKMKKNRRRRKRRANESEPLVDDLDQYLAHSDDSIKDIDSMPALMDKPTTIKGGYEIEEPNERIKKKKKKKNLLGEADLSLLKRQFDKYSCKPSYYALDDDDQVQYRSYWMERIAYCLDRVDLYSGFKYDVGYYTVLDNSILRGTQGLNITTIRKERLEFPYSKQKFNINLEEMYILDRDLIQSMNKFFDKIDLDTYEDSIRLCKCIRREDELRFEGKYEVDTLKFEI